MYWNSALESPKLNTANQFSIAFNFNKLAFAHDPAAKPKARELGKITQSYHFIRMSDQPRRLACGSTFRNDGHVSQRRDAALEGRVRAE